MLGWWLPENAAMQVDHVVHVVYWASGFVLLGAQVFLASARRGRAQHGPLMPEVVWAVVPALFLIGLGLGR